MDFNIIQEELYRDTIWFLQSVGSIGGIHYDVLITILGGILVAIIIQTIIIVKQIWKHVKIKNLIRGEIIKMFQTLEKCGHIADGHRQVTSSELKMVIFYSHISRLKEMMKLGENILKPWQFVEISNNLNESEKLMDMIKGGGQAPENKIYDMMLDGFKKIKWLKIPIEKLDFKE